MIRYTEAKTAKLRGSDEWGAGHFGASRGSRTHRGLDLLIPAGARVVCPVSGNLERIGQVYQDDPTFKIIEIRVASGALWRFFYVEKSLMIANVGDRILSGQILGKAQNLATRFPADGEDVPEQKRRDAMPNHIHVEIMVGGEWVDPEPILREIAKNRLEKYNDV